MVSCEPFRSTLSSRHRLRSVSLFVMNNDVHFGTFQDILRLSTQLGEVEKQIKQKGKNVDGKIPSLKYQLSRQIYMKSD